MYELASLSSLMEREVVLWVRGGLSLVNYKKRLESGTSVSESRPLSPAPHHLPTRWLFSLPGEQKELGCIHQGSLSIPVFLYVARRECRASWHMPESLTPLAAPSATLHLLRAHGLQSGGTGSGCWWPARWSQLGEYLPTLLLREATGPASQMGRGLAGCRTGFSLPLRRVSQLKHSPVPQLSLNPDAARRQRTSALATWPRGFPSLELGKGA